MAVCNPGRAGLFTGCGPIQRAQLREQAAEAQKVHAAEIAECERLHPDRNRKPVTPRVKCFNEANIRQASQGDPNVDLWRALSAQLLVVAEQYDTGRLTEAQFEATKASTVSDYTTRALQRQNNAMIANAAANQAAAAWAATGPTTCQRFGNSVTCY